MSNLVTISPGYVYSWGGRTQVISSQRKCTLSHGYVFSGLRFLQGTISPDTLTSWCVQCFLLICYHLLNSSPFCFFGSPWKMVCIWSGFLHRIYHWRSDSFPVFQFSQWNLLTLFVSRAPLLQLRNWPFYGYDNQVSILYHVIWNNHNDVRFKFDNLFTSSFSWWLIL